MDLSFLRQHRRVLFIGGAGVLLVVFAFAFLGEGDSSEEGAALFTEPKRGGFEVTVTSTGELRSQNSTQIRGPDNARRARIFNMKIQRLVAEGTTVEEGDVVAELDRSDLEGQTQDMRDQLQSARSAYEQAKIDTSMTLSQARDELVNQEYAMEEAKLQMEKSKYEAPSVKRQAEIDYDKARRALKQNQNNYAKQVQKARASVAEASRELDRNRRRMEDLDELASQFTIHAPHGGMVIYRRDDGRKVEQGDEINAWDPVVATLPDLTRMESITYVNEVDIQKVQRGQSVRIGLDAASKKSLHGTVTEVANVGQQRPGSSGKFFEVIVDIAGQDTTLRPGMTTSNTIVTAEREDALHIPLEAVHAQGDTLSYVFKSNGSRPVRQEVRLGLISQNRAIVERGITPEDNLYLSVPSDTSGLAWSRLEETPPRLALGAEGSRDAAEAPASERDSARSAAETQKQEALREARRSQDTEASGDAGAQE